MSEGGGWIEIVFLAMLAGFIALRLVSVLGRRTGHEVQPGDLARGAHNAGPDRVPAAPGGAPEVAAPLKVELPADANPQALDALQAIADADPSFDPARFVEGSKAAYRMTLEAFWRGDAQALDALVSDDVADQFKRAIAQRGGDAAPVDNRLVEVSRAAITEARLAGRMAEVTVRFDADIAQGTGPETSTNDIWTFSRHVGSTDPNWLLIATDDEE